MTIDGLLLTSERLAQFNTALGTDGLATLLAEAEAEVLSKTAGRTVDPPIIDSWVRVITLYNAYLAAEIGVPKDLSVRYEACQKELQEVMTGSSNFVMTSASGAWGGDTKIRMRLES